jgi:hypothetical protein
MSPVNALLFDWPFFGLVVGVLGLVALVAWPRPPGAPSRWRDPAWLVCLMLPVYMVHQFEEHGINLFGHRYHFIIDLCRSLGHSDLAGCPASPAFILAVNLGGGVWIPGLIAIAWRRRNVMVGACTLGVPLVNAAAHIVPAVVKGTYNSGLATALVLFVPMCAWALKQFRGAGILDGRRLAAIVASGVAVHALLAGSLIAHGLGLLSQTPLLAINVAYGLLPLVVASLPGIRSVPDDRQSAASAVAAARREHRGA